MTSVTRWQWFGNAAHLIVGDKCRFHLATRVGKYFVSTVGEYVPSSGTPDSGKYDTVGCDRLYETYVFHVAKGRGECTCGCGLPTFQDYGEIDSLPANDAKTARANHMKLCRKWAKK